VRLPLTQLSGTRAHWPDAPSARPGAKAPVGADYRVPA
jgi:hypothetical protein